LDQSEVASYVLHRKLIPEVSIVDGHFKVVDASRRNRNFKVIAQPGPSYLLKQGIGPAGATVAYESTVYQFLGRIPGKVWLRRHLPHYYGYDEDEGILILELASDARSFQEYQTRSGRFSTATAAALGLALGKFHRLTRSAITKTHDSRFSGRIPWVLSFHRPGLGLFRDISGANLQLLRIVQSTTEFQRMLDELREGWRADSLIHNDIKWDNCLVVPRSNSRRKTGLKIVDWEFADLGDSCWDAGAVFSNYLSFWLFSIPVAGEEPPDRFLELAQYPLERMQPAIRAYWQAYIRGMGLDTAKSQESLLRAVKYAAARLIQTGFEQMQRSTHLTGNVVCLLQLSLNITQRPREAIAHLLGISLKS
jgi:Phosphotransferase enzyme family